MGLKLQPLLACILLTFSAPVFAAETGLTLQLGASDGDFERRVVRYDCGGETPLQVVYLNAAPNFLALVPIEEEPEPLVFAAVLSGSGVRYAAGHWLWSTQGAEATLSDITLGEDADPVLTCSEFNNTP